MEKVTLAQAAKFLRTSEAAVVRMFGRRKLYPAYLQPSTPTGVTPITPQSVRMPRNSPLVVLSHWQFLEHGLERTRAYVEVMCKCGHKQVMRAAYAKKIRNCQDFNHVLGGNYANNVAGTVLNYTRVTR